MMSLIQKLFQNRNRQLGRCVLSLRASARSSSLVATLAKPGLRLGSRLGSHSALVRPLAASKQNGGSGEEESTGRTLGQRLFQLVLFVALFPVFERLSGKSLEAKEARDSSSNPPPPSLESASRRERFNFIADVVEQVQPSIVSIEIKEKLSVFHGFHSFGGSRDQTTITSGSGSGFVIDGENGFILTNAHVVRNYSSMLNVKLNDGRSFKGRVVKIDRASDLAIVKIDCDKLKAVKLGDSSKVRTGEFVIALGSPLTLSNTVTSGVVSNPKRDGAELGMNNELTYIQTDSIVTHGNSGGPLINLDGECIGINSMTATPGISFAIPSNYAIAFAKSVNSNSKLSTSANPAPTLPRPGKTRYLGMKMITVTPQIIHLFNMQAWSDIKLPNELMSGSLIIEVLPNTPAERAGLKRGDVIVSVNGQEVNANEDFFRELRRSVRLELIIIRNNVEIRMDVIAEERSD